MPNVSAYELQQKLYKRVGVASARSEHEPRLDGGSGSAQQRRRKVLRKTQRANKKLQMAPKQHKNATMKPRAQVKTQNHDQDFSSLDSRLATSSSSSAQDVHPRDFGTEVFSQDESDGSEAVLSLIESDGQQSQRDPKIESASKALLSQFAQDDAEIADFERRLGINKGRRSLPQAFKDDGLDELLGGIPADDDSASGDDSRKRKVAYDDWLSSKRRKADCKSSYFTGHDHCNVAHDSMVSDKPESMDKVGGFDEVENDGDDRLTIVSDLSFEGLDDTPEMPATTPRENPYIAPMSGHKIARYVPPSQRNQEEGKETRGTSQLHKKVQGLVNRLTDANLISLVHSVEEIYRSNARGEVTAVLTEAILAQIRKSETLPDQFFVLVGGFSAALYKILGSSFGSYLVKQVVKEFAEQYDAVSAFTGNHTAIAKESSNFLTFLTQLYVFEVVGCSILFDYMEKLLQDLSELNVELLLRVCRMAGRLLRKDDPQALKHVSNVLNAAVHKIGFANVSVRTKFMVETIQDLKNCKAKAKGLDSGIVSEHVLRMKKRLSELKSHSRRLDGLAPMNMGLKDIEDVGRHGQWWLVGASVPEYRRVADRAKAVSEHTTDTPVEAATDEDMDFVLPDFSKKARAQGLRTPTQIAIFTAIMSALDYEQGYRQFANLNLKRNEQLEITRVLVQCVGSEVQYNEYYALVGRQACSNSRVRFSFQDRLWKIFRGLGESLFGGEADDGDEELMEAERMKNERRLRHVAQFYASLVANGSLSIHILKPVDLTKMNAWSSIFVEWFLISLLRECRARKIRQDKNVERIFGAAMELPVLAAGLRWYLARKLHDVTSIGDKERKRLQIVIKKARFAVQAAEKEAL